MLRKFHIDQVSGLLKENNGLIGYGTGLISISFTKGCENIDELIKAIDASNNSDLIIK